MNISGHEWRRNFIMCNCSCNDMSIDIPNTNQKLTPGCRVKLGRFETVSWIVQFGWFSYGGNRPFCGWYLTNNEDGTIKPLQLPDLDDIYMIEH